MQEHAALEQELATRHDREIAKRNEKIKKLINEWEESSLLSVLPGTNCPIPKKLSPRGLPGYHSHLKDKEDASAQEIQFCVPDVRDLNNRLELDLGYISSALRTLINFDDSGILTYENEYDVQEIVQKGLRDAVNICNRIIVKKLLELPNFVNSSSSNSSSSSTGTRTGGGYSPAPRRIVLNVRRESSIFSNVVDHVVVFDQVSRAPVFLVVSKIGWDSPPPGSNKDTPPLPTAAVLGQVYDQLSEMHAKGHPNPFGAVTCFDETYITCLDNYECHDVLGNLSKEGYNDSRLDRIVRNLAVVQESTNNGCNSPPSPSNYDPSQDTSESTLTTAAVWNIKNDDDAKGNGFVCHSNRTLLHSACFTPDDIVATFVSAILCSLDGYRKPRAIKSFTPKEDIQLEVLRINETSYDWGVLTTKYQGPYTNNSIWKGWKWLPRIIRSQQPLYLVDHLGTGTTSKVYRALTEDGHDCVVKMYVKCKDDDKKILTIEDFDKKGKAAVEREWKKYKEIYGAELDKYVWKEKLNGLHCLIHPYFKHVEKNHRTVGMHCH